jgi:cytochrome c oxidase subunit II
VFFEPRPIHRDADQPGQASGFRRTRRLLPLVSALALPLILSACAANAPQDGFTPGSERGPIPRAINRVAHPTFIIAGVIMVLVYVLVLYTVVKFRRKDDDAVPMQVHGNKMVEIASVGLASLVLIGLGIPATATFLDQRATPKDAYEITVIGHQWWWEYRYPAQGDKLTTSFPRDLVLPDEAKAAKAEKREPKHYYGIPKDSVPVMVNANELHIPEGRNVVLAITSMDVLHNYWVPKLSGKIYAIPGRVNHLNIKADVGLAKPGKPYFIYGQCAEFCGTSHANMRFKVVVQTKADFDAWMANQQKPAVAAKAPTKKADGTEDFTSLTEQEALVYKGETIFKGSGACSSCHYQESSKGWDPTVDAAKIGPNLTHVGGRAHFAGAIAPLDQKNLTAWLRNPQAFKPGSKMVIRSLNDDEVKSLVAYIKSLK